MQAETRRDRVRNGQIVATLHQEPFLVNDQRDAQILFDVFISTYNSLHVSSTMCSKHVESYK